MTEKRFENRLDKSNVKFNTLNPVWDNEKETGLNVFEMIDELNKLSDENEQLKQENSVFEGKDAKHYQRWVNQIKKYIEEDNPDFTYDEDFIIKIALSYTLQSLRNGESLKRFQWNYKELIIMTENKQFKLSEPHGLYLIKDDKPLYHWLNDDDKIIDLLNNLSDENKQIKHIIKEAYNNERTQIGKNVLKQLMEQIQ